MKTVQSFFPTTTKSKASFKKDSTFKIMKKVQQDIKDNFISQNTPIQKFSQQIHNPSPKNGNIFRDKNNTIKNYSLDQNNQRPIGGSDLFKKMQKANHLNIEESTRRLSKKGSRKNIKQSRQKLMSNHSRSYHHVNLVDKDKIHQQFKQQTFKQHTDIKQKYIIHQGNKIYGSKSVGKYQSQFNPTSNASRKCSTSYQKYGRKIKLNNNITNKNQPTMVQTGKSASVQSLNTNSQQQNHQIRWASEQQRNYLDKMAILNQINYNKPLIQKLGSKYFECFLRNRYLDEPQFNHKSPFIYQIKQKLADTKFISKIKSMKPHNFMERNKIVLKGRNKLSKQQQDKMDVKDAKKRWQDWNQDSFQL